MSSRFIISLTTDFGLQDYYAGALKGALLRACPQAQLVDVSHSVRPFDIVQAALVVQNAFAQFPPGSLHLIGVNCAYAPDSRFIVAFAQEHYFAAPDNGLLTLMFEQLAETRALLPSAAGTLAAIEVFARAAEHLGAGRPIAALGVPAGPLTERIGLRPVTTRSRIRGTVIYVDHFENVQVNIRRETFERVGQGRPFSLLFKRHDPITTLSQHYTDVPVGEPLCLFNSAGFLEIAVNMGRAATLLGLKEEDVVEVVFEEEQS